MFSSILQKFLYTGIFFSFFLEIHIPTFHSVNVFLIFRILMISIKCCVFFQTMRKLRQFNFIKEKRQHLLMWLPTVVYNFQYLIPAQNAKFIIITFPHLLCSKPHCFYFSCSSLHASTHAARPWPTFLPPSNSPSPFPYPSGMFFPQYSAWQPLHQKFSLQKDFPKPP